MTGYRDSSDPDLPRRSDSRATRSLVESDGRARAQAQHGPSELETVRTGAVLSDVSVRTRHLFGFDFIDDSDNLLTVERILGVQPNDGHLPLVVTPNVDDIVQLGRPEYAALARISRQARYVLPDGQPLVWTSRLAGRPLSARLPGSQLFGPLWARIVADSRSAVVLAPSKRVATRLSEENPLASVLVAPLFKSGDRTALEYLTSEIWAAVSRSEAEFVILGIGFPKQQQVALGLLNRMAEARRNLPIVLLVGGSLNIHTGMVPPAPRWVQNFGVEFLFRFTREPRRLFFRYFVRDSSFLPLMMREVREIRTINREGPL